MGERWLYYTFNSTSVHDVPTGVVETRKQDTNGKVRTGQEVPSRQVLWLVPAERPDKFVDKKVLVWIQADAR